MQTLYPVVLVPLFCAIAMQPCQAISADKMTGLKEVKTTAEIVKGAKDDHRRGGYLGEPSISTAQFSSDGFQVFVAWHNPYSGEATCQVYLYVFDAEKAVWVRKVANEFPGTHTVSVEFVKEETILLKDIHGKEIQRYSIEP